MQEPFTVIKTADGWAVTGTSWTGLRTKTEALVKAAAERAAEAARNAPSLAPYDVQQDERGRWIITKDGEHDTAAGHTFQTREEAAEVARRRKATDAYHDAAHEAATAAAGISENLSPYHIEHTWSGEWAVYKGKLLCFGYKTRQRALAAARAWRDQDRIRLQERARRGQPIPLEELPTLLQALRAAR